MRIAVSGTHRSGKSTLIEALATLLPRYATVDEPYELLEQDGYEFAHPPSLEDFEAQLEQSIASLAEEDGRHVLFDRSPLDFVAYASLHEDGDSFELEAWLPKIRGALESLDLLVLVPLETPDRIVCSRAEDPTKSRVPVDEKLRELLLDDALDLGVAVLEVEGSVGARAKSVMQRLRQPTP